MYKTLVGVGLWKGRGARRVEKGIQKREELEDRYYEELDNRDYGLHLDLGGNSSCVRYIQLLNPLQTPDWWHSSECRDKKNSSSSRILSPAAPNVHWETELQDMEPREYIEIRTSMTKSFDLIGQSVSLPGIRNDAELL